MTKIYQKKYFLYASIGFLLLFSAGCRSARFLEDGQALVVRTQIEGLSPSMEEEAQNYIPQSIQPNSRINLFFYNLINTQKGKYKSRNIRRVGEAPHILDSALVDLSAMQINRFLFNKGYLEAKVTDSIHYKGKKASIRFLVDTGEPFNINRILLEVEDPSVAALYLQSKHDFTNLRPGFRLDIDSIAAEREAIYSMMRRNGYVDYMRQYMYVDIDTNLTEKQADLLIHIDNPTGQQAHIKYVVDSSLITIRHQDPDRNPEQPHITKTSNGLTFHDYTGKFRTKSLSRYFFLFPGDIYNLDRENLTYDRLFDLNSFRSVNSEYVRLDSNKLGLNYELTPRPYMSNQVEGEYTFSGGMSGFNLANTFSHRNLFGGSEQLDIKLGYGVLFDSRLPGTLFDRIFNNDFQIGVNISVPRLLVPFKEFSFNYIGLPRTTFTSSLQIFDQVLTYSNRYAVNTISYFWNSSPNKQHQFSPLVLEYRHGRLDGNFAQDLIDKGYLLYVRSNNRAYFGLGSQYIYTYNGPKLLRKENFFYMRGALELSGNVLNFSNYLFNFSRNDDGEKEIFGVPYLQYTKMEGDFRFYRYLGGDRQLVFRLNPGLALPYGNNSSLLIFEKSFFGGGMNGMRAWQARTLGPGNYNREDLDPSLRMNLRNLDQLGEIKLEANMEYRFRIMHNLWGAKVKGATFTDIGNIWQLHEQQLTPGGKFEADKFLGQLGIGAGAGLRFDLDYFIIRFDVGAKVRDPQFEAGNQWVIGKWFKGARAFKNDYAQSNAPDRYRFVQYNFGIGMPF
ncbi:MAG TPA: BamA/TamA family outer membrane protein [Sphingobacteriaceae bacterium]|nr:BamA/TamA family outer membrane protein [Sphingobacteriaceae bacterium]